MNALPELLDPFHSPFDSLLANDTIERLFLRTLDPEDTVALDRSQRRFEAAVELVWPVLAERVLLARKLDPGGRMGLEPLAEPGVLAPGFGQNAQEPTVAACDVFPVLLGAQLGVGHVEEISSAGHPAERVPGANVRLVAAGVAIVNARPDRYAFIRRRRQDLQQLLQIGAVILVEAVGDQ